jgi:hypothetical protein
MRVSLEECDKLSTLRNITNAKMAIQKVITQPSIDEG